MHFIILQANNANVQFHVGWFNTTMYDLDNKYEFVAFLHIDVDLYSR